MKVKRRAVAFRALAVGLLVGVALPGCSYVPDWANPGEWFSDRPPPPPRRSAGKPAPAQNQQTQQVAQDGAANKPYPDLASTPERPQPRTSEAQRRQIQQGLIADRENARYSEQVPIGDSAQAGAPPPPAPAQSSLAPAPPALPRTPVAEQPAPPPPQEEQPRVFSADRPAAPEPPRPTPTTTPPAPPPLTAGPTPAAPRRAAPEPSAAPAAAAPPPPPPAMPPPPAPQASLPPAPTVPQVNLPIGQDQQALAQAFSQGVAAQASPYAGAPAAGGFAPPAAPNATAPLGGTALGAPAGAPAATITFPHGGSSLSAGDLETVRRIAKAARQGAVVRVVGHASQRTGNMSMERHRLVNFNVSFDRAQAVARALRRAGVDPSRLIVEAVGDSQPRYYEFMPNGEAENRRVEIFLE